MVSWFRSKRIVPPVSAGNPGRGAKVSAGFSSAQRTWEEHINLLDCLAGLLISQGYKFTRHKEWLELDGGLTLRPQFESFDIKEDASVSTRTTIEAHHQTVFPGGAFEYQHAAGANLDAAFTAGFDSWAQLDLPVLLDALKPEPEVCLILNMNFAGEPRIQSARRVLLGPTMHLVKHDTAHADEEHSFCPCCLFTNSFEAFKPLLESADFCGIRLFAARDDAGNLSADCRVNGEDWDAGASALKQYAQSWAQRGLEYRKQYVVIQNNQG